MQNNPLKQHLLKSKELPPVQNLLKGQGYQAETVLGQDTYYTRLYYPDRIRPKTLEKKFA